MKYLFETDTEDQPQSDITLLMPVVRAKNVIATLEEVIKNLQPDEDYVYISLTGSHMEKQ